MKSFEQWLKTGPLKDEVLTKEERTLMGIAYLEGAGAALEESQASLKRLLPEQRAA